VAPTGWVILDGAPVPAGCPQLTALYGANLPNLKGKVIVGYDAGDASFNTLLGTGGSKDAIAVSHNHTQDAHNHTQDTHNHTQNGHNHTQDAHHHAAAANQFVITHNADPYRVGDSVGSTFQQVTFTTNDADTTATNQAQTATNQTLVATNQGATATNQSAGSSGTGANLVPYRVFNYIVRQG
jgi:hypothetical protein